MARPVILVSLGRASGAAAVTPGDVSLCWPGLWGQRCGDNAVLLEPVPSFHPCAPGEKWLFFQLFSLNKFQTQDLGWTGTIAGPLHPEPFLLLYLALFLLH